MSKTKIERREQRLKKTFEKEIQFKDAEIDRAGDQREDSQQIIIAAHEEIQRLTKLIEKLLEEKAELVADYNEFLETLEPEGEASEEE